MPEKATLAQLEMAQAVVYDYLKPTPEICWPLLSQRCGCEVWVKHENHSYTGAFKVRGGLNYLNDLCKNNTPVSGIISATRGNHGQSLAFACAQKGIPLTIIVPNGNNPEKNHSMKAFGAELLVYGEDFQEARERAEVIAADKELHLIGAFHPLLMRGVGTYAMEFFSQVSDLDKVYVPVGQGSHQMAVTVHREDDLQMRLVQAPGSLPNRGPDGQQCLLPGRPFGAGCHQPSSGRSWNRFFRIPSRSTVRRTSTTRRAVCPSPWGS